MKRFFRVQLAIAVLALIIGVGALVSAVPQAQAFVGVCTYYQTAAMKKVVGQRGTGCCGESINWGIVTQYRTCGQIYCTDVWCGNPTE